MLTIPEKKKNQSWNGTGYPNHSSFVQSCHPGELAPIRERSLGFLNLEASCRQEPIFNFTPEDECKYMGVRVGMCSHRVLEVRKVGEGEVWAPLLSEVKRGDGFL